VLHECHVKTARTPLWTGSNATKQRSLLVANCYVSGKGRAVQRHPDWLQTGKTSTFPASRYFPSGVQPLALTVWMRTCICCTWNKLNSYDNGLLKSKTSKSKGLYLATTSEKWVFILTLPGRAWFNSRLQQNTTRPPPSFFFREGKKKKKPSVYLKPK